MPIQPKSRFSASVVGVLVAMLTACGGKTPTSPSDNSTVPTAVLVNSSATATALATEAKGLIDVAIKRSQLPAAITLASAPTGVVITTPCPGGGNFTYDYPTTLTSSSVYTTTYNNCSYSSGYAINGSSTTRYSSFNNASNFAWTTTYNISVTGAFSYSYSGTYTCSIVNGVSNCSVSVDGRTLESSFSYSYATNTVNGSYTWNYASLGTVRYNVSNWGPTSGTIQVVGANNTSATIVRTGANSYSVTINGGTPYTLTL